MESRDLTAAHGALTAVRAGEGRDLVLFHPLLADRHAFDPVLPALAREFRVTALNLPGFDGSEPVLAAVMDAYIARLEDGFEEFGLRDAVLIGNGFGGTVALAFALAHPTRLTKVVVCDAAPAFPEAGKQALRLMAEKVTAGGVDAVAEMAANRLFHPGYLATHPQAVEECRAALMRIDPKAFGHACQVLVDTDLVPLLPKLKLPTLVVCGALDQATPPALNRKIADEVPGARYVEIPGCGHCPPLEQPQAFLDALGEFIGLTRPERGGGRSG